MEIPKNPKHIHMIAICGTGMGSLATLLTQAGYRVTGSDQAIYPPMSTHLQGLGIRLFEGYGRRYHLKLPHDRGGTRDDNPPDLVVIGNAVSKNNPEVEEVVQLGIPYLSFPQALQQFFMQGKKSLVVAGTHGKTTTTALLAHCLETLGTDPSYLIGGIPQGDQPNVRRGRGDYFVIEGDEYDTAFFDKGPKFLHYAPFYSILTSMEFDHADIYRDLGHVKESFVRFIDLIPETGGALVCQHYPDLVRLAQKCRGTVQSYGMEGADWTAQAIRFTATHTEFTINHRGKPDGSVTTTLSGGHNVLNVLSVYALLRSLGSWTPGARPHGFKSDAIARAISSFQGVKRRQEVIYNQGGLIIIDDFAHHPTAVRETIQAIRQRYPECQLWAVFEPRSNTSKRAVFQQEYAQAFAGADQAILARVFQPEKVPDGRVLDVARLATEITAEGTPARVISDTASIVSYLLAQVSAPAVILIMSNGGFDGLHHKLIKGFDAS